jgi:hypothetical protein
MIGFNTTTRSRKISAAPTHKVLAVFGATTLPLFIVGMLGFASGTARAGIAQVSSRSALGGNDVLNWTQISSLGFFTTPVTVTTEGGLTATLSSTGILGPATQGTKGAAWDGNFAPGAPLVFTGQFGPSGPIVITFARPVSAVGAQMNYNWTASSKADPFPFNITLSLYNSAGTLLATYTAQGEQYPVPDNSAAFIGAIDSTAEITQAVFSTTTTANYAGSFAINNLAVDASRVCTQ